MIDLQILKEGIPLSPLPELPPYDETIPHAPKRAYKLSQKEFKVRQGYEISMLIACNSLQLKMPYATFPIHFIVH
jgi:hypothetical protein